MVPSDFPSYNYLQRIGFFGPFSFLFEWVPCSLAAFFILFDVFQLVLFMEWILFFDIRANKKVCSFVEREQLLNSNLIKGRDKTWKLGNLSQQKYFIFTYLQVYLTVRNFYTYLSLKHKILSLPLICVNPYLQYFPPNEYEQTE